MTRPEEQSVSRAGLHLVGQGREAEVFEWRDGRVLRLLRVPGAVGRLAFEVAALEAARAAGVPVPQVYEEVVVEGRPGLVMEHLQGPDLLTMLGRKPWRVRVAGRTAGRIHARINRANAPASLPAVRDVMRRRLARLALSEPVLAESVGRLLARLPDGDALCHGDFHPGQLMLSGDGWVALDWSVAGRGDALCDYARTRVLLSIGEPPPGTPRTLRLLARIGRQLLMSAYAGAYERAAGTPLDRSRLRHWEIVNLAMRLVDDIPGERARVLTRLRHTEGVTW
jgi:tRNA A-37 threonylcarbamoyl transferase component Bud32